MPSSPDFQKAEAQFDKLTEADPYRIDEIDILSNILYVAENRTKLSKMAHHYLSIEKERPEICVLVGMSDSAFTRERRSHCMKGIITHSEEKGRKLFLTSDELLSSTRTVCLHGLLWAMNSSKSRTLMLPLSRTGER